MTRRTSEHSPCDLELALRSAREALGSDEAVQRVHAGLLGKIARGSAPPSAAQATSPWLAKRLVLLLAATGGAAWYAAASSGPAAAPSARANSERPAVTTAAEAPPAAQITTPSQPRAERTAQPGIADEHGPKPARVDLGPAQPPTPRTAAAVTRPARAPTHRQHPPRRDVAGTAPEPTAVPPTVTAEPCSDPDAEVSLLSRAQRALGVQPKAALALLDEHGRRYACGVLAQERDIMRVDAERTLGLDAQARAHARALIARYPESHEATVLRNWLSEADDDSDDHKSETVSLPTP